MHVLELSGGGCCRRPRLSPRLETFGRYDMKKWETILTFGILLVIWATGYLLSRIMGMG